MGPSLAVPAPRSCSRPLVLQEEQRALSWGRGTRLSIGGGASPIQPHTGTAVAWQLLTSLVSLSRRTRLGVLSTSPDGSSGAAPAAGAPSQPGRPSPSGSMQPTGRSSSWSGWGRRSQMPASHPSPTPTPLPQTSSLAPGAQCPQSCPAQGSPALGRVPQGLCSPRTPQGWVPGWARSRRCHAGPWHPARRCLHCTEVHGCRAAQGGDVEEEKEEEETRRGFHSLG